MKKKQPTTRIGLVVSVKMKSTIIVEVVGTHRHLLYKKSIKRSKRFAVHVPEGMQVSLGDTVRIEETKPISKTKYFVLTGVVNK